jgi:hypothetical protein
MGGIYRAVLGKITTLPKYLSLTRPLTISVVAARVLLYLIKQQHEGCPSEQDRIIY